MLGPIPFDDDDDDISGGDVDHNTSFPADLYGIDMYVNSGSS